jgi:hypothetical protein
MITSYLLAVAWCRYYRGVALLARQVRATFASDSRTVTRVRRESGAYVTQMLRARFAYDVRHIAHVSTSSSSSSSRFSHFIALLSFWLGSKKLRALPRNKGCYLWTPLYICRSWSGIVTWWQPSKRETALIWFIKFVGLKRRNPIDRSWDCWLRNKNRS